MQINDNLSPESKSPKGSGEPKVTKKLLSGSRRSSLPWQDDRKKDENIVVTGDNNTEAKSVVEISVTEDKKNSLTSDVASGSQKPSKLTNAPGGSKRQWGRTPVSLFPSALITRMHPFLFFSCS